MLFRVYHIQCVSHSFLRAEFWTFSERSLGGLSRLQTWHYFWQHYLSALCDCWCLWCGDNQYFQEIISMWSCVDVGCEMWNAYVAVQLAKRSHENSLTRITSFEENTPALIFEPKLYDEFYTRARVVWNYFLSSINNVCVYVGGECRGWSAGPIRILAEASLLNSTDQLSRFRCGERDTNEIRQWADERRPLFDGINRLPYHTTQSQTAAALWRTRNI